MMDPISSSPIPTQSASESLRLLTLFARDIGQTANIRTLAEYVLETLLEQLGVQEGTLYVLDPGRSHFDRLAVRGSSHTKLAMATMTMTHPLVHDLTRHQELVDQSALAGSKSQLHTDLLQSMPENFPWKLAIPLINRGRLVAFALLQWEAEPPSQSQNCRDLLVAMAQCAANAVDSLLAHEDLRQSQVLMRRTDRLRSLETIAAGFAHEIRNPLTSIKTFIQLTPERKDDAHFIQGFSQIVLDDVHRIERLIQEILDYARYMDPQLTEEDLNTVVSSCLYFIDVKARSRGIKIEKELASEIPRVMLDRQQMKQVLLNLFLNAMDAMGEDGGTLQVRTRMIMKPEGHGWVQVEIEDTGHGISPANLEHIFDPFFTTKHESGENEGTGLGLSIAHQIIQEHRGHIQVRSTEGVGTVFLINLPSFA